MYEVGKVYYIYIYIYILCGCRGGGVYDYDLRFVTCRVGVHKILGGESNLACDGNMHRKGE